MRQNPKMNNMNRGSLINEVTIIQGGKRVAAASLFLAVKVKHDLFMKKKPSFSINVWFKGFSSITILRYLYEATALIQTPWADTREGRTAGTRTLRYSISDLLKNSERSLSCTYKIIREPAGCHDPQQLGVFHCGSFPLVSASGWSCHSLTWAAHLELIMAIITGHSCW